MEPYGFIFQVSNFISVIHRLRTPLPSWCCHPLHLFCQPILVIHIDFEVYLCPGHYLCSLRASCQADDQYDACLHVLNRANKHVDLYANFTITYKRYEQGSLGLKLRAGTSYVGSSAQCEEEEIQTGATKTFQLNGSWWFDTVLVGYIMHAHLPFTLNTKLRRMREGEDSALTILSYDSIGYDTTQHYFPLPDLTVVRVTDTLEWSFSVNCGALKNDKFPFFLILFINHPVSEDVRTKDIFNYQKMPLDEFMQHWGSMNHDFKPELEPTYESPLWVTAGSDGSLLPSVGLRSSHRTPKSPIGTVGTAWKDKPRSLNWSHWNRTEGTLRKDFAKGKNRTG